MNPWHFLKRQLQRGNNKDNGERSVTQLVEVASSLLQGGDYVKAQAVLLRVLNSQSEIQEPIFLEWILTSLARTWEETEDYRRWTDFFTDFIGQNPNSAIAYHLRAESHWYAGSLREALADYTQSIELNPNDAGAFLGRGQVLMECHDFARALEDLDCAMARMDNVPYADSAWKADFEAFATNGRGAAYAGLGDVGRAMQEFEKSIALCPENAWVYFNRAQAYQNQADRENAVVNYKLALEKEGPKLTSTKRAHAKAQITALEA